MSNQGDKKTDQGTELLTRQTEKLQRPRMYRVILLNDDYTPQEFVVWVLSRVFHKSRGESMRIMLEAHTAGKSTIGIYTHDVARTKVTQVMKIAQQNDHPLECIIEAMGDRES